MFSYPYEFSMKSCEEYVDNVIVIAASKINSNICEINDVDWKTHLIASRELHGELIQLSSRVNKGGLLSHEIKILNTTQIVPRSLEYYCIENLLLICKKRMNYFNELLSPSSRPSQKRPFEEIV